MPCRSTLKDDAFVGRQLTQLNHGGRSCRSSLEAQFHTFDALPASSGRTSAHPMKRPRNRKDRGAHHTELYLSILLLFAGEFDEAFVHELFHAVATQFATHARVFDATKWELG